MRATLNQSWQSIGTDSARTNEGWLIMKVVIIVKGENTRRALVLLEASLRS